MGFLAAVKDLAKEARRYKWEKYLAKECENNIHCPRCALHYSLEPNSLGTLGDEPETLFCPSCNLEVSFKIYYHGRDGL